MSSGAGAIAVTMGEPAGIGGELTLSAWQNRADQNLPPFFAIDSPDRLARIAERLNWDVPLTEIDAPEAATGCFGDSLPVLPLDVPGSTTPGQPDPTNASSVVASIRKAAEYAMTGSATAVLTNPIHKKTLYDAGFQHPGHTEFFAEIAGIERSVMMLLCPGLRVVPITSHISLAQAIQALRTDDIVAASLITVQALRRDFGIETPHIMMAALNPHGGEDGSMGREELDIIVPAIDSLKQQGVSVSGPAPADSMFHERAREGYDAAICMYHDQALIPLKTIDFHSGVNVTLGLPFVRTSPDHGTALEIAGMGVADDRSFVASLSVAADIVRQRGRYRTRDSKALA